MIAFDLDGVICSDKTWSVREERLHARYGWIYLFLNIMFREVWYKPECEFIIITGRHESSRLFTWLWLRLHGIKPKKLIMNPIRHYSIDWLSSYKAVEILANQVDLYYEDNTKIYNQLLTKELKTTLCLIKDRGIALINGYQP